MTTTTVAQPPAPGLPVSPNGGPEKPSAAVQGAHIVPSAQGVEIHTHIDAAQLTNAEVGVSKMDNQELHAGELKNIQLHGQELNPYMGLRTTKGDLVDYTPQDKADRDRMLELLIKYGRDPQNLDAPPNPNFSINLRTLKDHLGNPLQRMPGETAKQFLADMRELRSLYEKSVGKELSWNNYHPDSRTALGLKDTFSPEESHRLRKMRMTDAMLEELKKDQKPEERKITELNYERSQKLMARSNEILDQLHQAAGKGQEALQRTQNIRTLRSRMPERGDKTEKGDKEALERQYRHTAISYASTELGKIDYTKEEELKAAVERAKQFIEKTSLPAEDKKLGGPAGVATALLTFGMASSTLGNDISDSNKHAEEEYAKQLVLLHAPDRASYEKARLILGAEERSDGSELFFHQLNQVIVGAENESQIVDFMENAECVKTILGSLYAEDRKAYCNEMTRVALALFKNRSTS